MMPTILTTDRLTLRPLTEADAAPIRAYCGDWEVARRLARIPHPYPEGLAEAFIADQAWAHDKGGAHIFAIEAEGELAGVVGLERRDHPLPQESGWELGYWLGRPWWGRGIASEAACRLTRFAFAPAPGGAGVPRLLARYHADNPASGRVLAKCGFRESGRGPSPCLAQGRAVPAVFVALDAPLDRG